MADKKNTSKRQTTATKSARSATKVTIKKASETKDTKPKATAKSRVAKKPVVKAQSSAAKSRRLKWPRFFVAIGTYFKGAWFELRQVRWPDRKATWGLTLAVILFSVFFAALILGLDYVFQLLFKNILL